MQGPKSRDVSQKALAAGVPEYVSVQKAIDDIVKAQMLAKGLPTSRSRRRRAAKKKDPNWSRTSVDEMLIEREAAENIALAIQRGALKVFSVRSLLPLTHGIEWNDVEYLDALLIRDELQQFAREHLRVEIPLQKREKKAKPSALPKGQEAAADDQREARPSATDWRELARVEATLIIERDRKSDLYPNQTQVADEVARRFRSRGIFGADGKPLAGSTIKRHALKGIEAGKLACRGMRGHRGK
jgi:hypothetical protein